MKNLAILISGPPRNIHSLLGRIEADVVKIDYHFEVFIHVWKTDGGTKSRGDDYNLDINEIQNNYSWVKQIILESPYEDSDYSSFPFEKLETGQSNAAAIMGMFLGVNRLVDSIKLNPKIYTHVLRLRTDNVLIDENFFYNISDMLDDNVYVSRNYLIPYQWISDHIMLAPLEKFSALWSVSNLNDFFVAYSKNNANPERYLGWKAKKLGYFKNVKVGWLRYRDYHILYASPRKGDPLWCHRLDADEIGALFLTPKKFITPNDIEELENIIRDQKANQDRYARPIYLKIIGRLTELIK